MNMYQVHQPDSYHTIQVKLPYNSNQTTIQTAIIISANYNTGAKDSYRKGIVD